MVVSTMRFSKCADIIIIILYHFPYVTTIQNNIYDLASLVLTETFSLINFNQDFKKKNVANESRSTMLHH